MNWLQILQDLLSTTGFSHFTLGNLVMIAVAGAFFYMAIARGFEPLLLVPIAFGTLLANLPLTGLMEDGGLLDFFFFGVRYEIFPPLIFLGVGALTDFGPLLANPATLLLGAASQFGVYLALLGARMAGFTLAEAGSIGIIGGADGPTAIYLTMRLAPHLVGPIAVAAYSYMSLVPLIQPPIIKAMTSKKERSVVMAQMRNVSRLERILFPILVTVFIVLVLPPVAPLVGMLMLGNLLRESGVTARLAGTAQNELINIVTILLALSVGATMDAASFLRADTLLIVAMGLVAFAGGTATGVILGKVFYWLSKGTINPMIGAAGVSAVPMAARGVHRMGREANPDNYLLMHAMGPNVAGVIGTAVAAGVILVMLG